MNIIQIEIFVVSFIIITIVLVIINNKQKNKKLAIDKRKHIQMIYTKNIQNILKGSSSQENKIKKLEYIKKCNSELSRNIFFTKSEADQLIKELSQL
jgi:hypothetical protein